MTSERAPSAPEKTRAESTFSHFISILLSSKLFDTKDHALNVLYLHKSLEHQEEGVGFKEPKDLDELEIEASTIFNPLLSSLAGAKHSSYPLLLTPMPLLRHAVSRIHRVPNREGQAVPSV